MDTHSFSLKAYLFFYPLHHLPSNKKSQGIQKCEKIKQVLKPELDIVGMMELSD
jgi:hypothetical protein